MASTSSRRGPSHRPLERQFTRGDDPWCLVCGVNLALDGRTFSIVSNHQNSDLSDALGRVLGMKFTEDNASVNVCNRCERHIKRIGRTTNNASARVEGRQFREQAEKNMVKNFQTGVELGEFREISASASAVSSSKAIREGVTTSAVRRGTSIDPSSSARNARDQFSRSSSVRFDEEEARKGASNRDHSAPEKMAQKRERELQSSWDESKSKDVRRGTRSGAYSPSVERAGSVRISSTDQKAALERRSQQRASVIREKTRSITRTNTVDASKKSGKVPQGQISSNNGQTDNITSHDDSKKRSDAVVSPRAVPRKKQTTDRDAGLPELSPDQTNPFLFDEQATEEDKNFDNAGPFDNDTPIPFEEDLDRSVDERDYFQGKEDFEDVEESVLKNDKHGFTESGNHARPNGDNSKPPINSPTLDYKTQSSDQRRNSEQSEEAEDLAEDGDKYRARKPKVSFVETVGPDETEDGHQPVRSSPSATVLNEKGKLSKYESLDLEIDNNNPFFDDVYGEYNRRVYVSSRIWNAGSPNSIKRNLQKPEAIPEVDDAEGSQRSPAEHDGSETAKEDPVPGENLQDSTPLIGDGEENKEENRDNEDVQDGITHPDKEKEDIGDREDSVEGGDEEHDGKSLDGETTGRGQEDGSEVMVHEVIQATQLAPPVNPDHANTHRSDEAGLEVNSPEENDSQISQQPTQTEGGREVKSEASPLIDKESETAPRKGKRPIDSRLKDQQPGFVCCNIL